MTVSETFPGQFQGQSFDYQTASGSAQPGAAVHSTTTVRYDAPTQSYVVTDRFTGTGDMTFGPADKVAARSDAAYTVYEKVDGTTTDTLTLSNPGAANPVIALTYTGYGLWRHATPRTGAVAYRDIHFIYGIKTAGSDMPRTGTASYDAVIDGTYVGSAGIYTLGGNGNFLADFGGGTMTFSATPTASGPGGAILSFGTLNGTGSINFASSSFSATAGTASPTTYQMGLSGYFFGPQASEIGSVFDLVGGTGRGTGVMVGRGN